MESYLYEKNTDYKILIYLIYVVLLTLGASAVSAHVTGLLLSGGLFVMTVAYCSLEEEKTMWMTFMEIVFAGIFAFCADTLFGFSVFCGLPMVRRRRRYVLMTVGFAVSGFLHQENDAFDWTTWVHGNAPADLLLGFLFYPRFFYFFIWWNIWWIRQTG